MYNAVIIDDEPWTRHVIQMLGKWEDYGIDIIGEAADGESGLELIHRLHPDIIITDVRMPGLNGIELIGELRRENNMAKVIIISGYDDFSYVHDAMKLSVTDYLLKPIKQQELNEQLQRCVEAIREQGQEILRVSASAGRYTGETAAVMAKITEALRQWNEERMPGLFQQLYVQLEKDEDQSISGLVGIYYTMLIPLQKELETRNYRMGDVFSGKTSSFVFSKDSRLDQLIRFLCELYTAACRRIRQDMKERQRINIDEICQYLEAHYSEDISLERIADSFYVSKEYLSRVFKAQKGVGFSNYLTGFRMEKAKVLILSTDLSFKDIGARVGYEDLGYFYKIFKRFYGITPKNMRDGLKKDNNLH